MTEQQDIQPGEKSQEAPTSYLPAIVTVGYNRPAALERLLHSLTKAHYPEGVPLIISIDYGADNHQEVMKVAQKFVWTYGEKRVIAHEKNLGLRPHILSCGEFESAVRKCDRAGR